MADTALTFGANQIIDTGSNLEINYGGTVRLIINKSTGNISVGAIDGTGSNTLNVSVVNAGNEVDCGYMQLTTNSLKTKASGGLTMNVGTTNDQDVDLLRNNASYIVLDKSNFKIVGNTPIEFMNGGVFEATGLAGATLGSVPMGVSASQSKWLKMADDGGHTIYIPVWQA